MQFSDNQAISLIQNAIQNGAVKLQGPAGSNQVDSAKTRAEIDAAYLKHLYELLQSKQA